MRPIHSGSGSGAEGVHPHGWASTQGVRPTMEDEMILGVPLGGDLHLWAVLDGHGGRETVERLSTLLPEALSGALKGTSGAELDERTVRATIEDVDRRLLAEHEEKGWTDGATALLMLCAGGTSATSLQLAQLGDSQAVLCSVFGTEALCTQHRPDDPVEEARLNKVGARVEDGRVMGSTRAVAVTRALGDLDCKLPGGVIATPEVTEKSLSPADEMLIIGCDGLWDVMEPDDAWALAKRKAKGRNGMWDLEKAARALVEGAVDRKTGDNVSVIVLGLKRPRTTTSNVANPNPPPPAADAAAAVTGAEVAAAVTGAEAPGSSAEASASAAKLVIADEEEYVAALSPALEFQLSEALSKAIALRHEQPVRFIAQHLLASVAPADAEASSSCSAAEQTRSPAQILADFDQVHMALAGLVAGGEPSPDHSGSSVNPSVVQSASSSAAISECMARLHQLAHELGDHPRH